MLINLFKYKKIALIVLGLGLILLLCGCGKQEVKLNGDLLNKHKIVNAEKTSKGEYKDEINVKIGNGGLLGADEEFVPSVEITRWNEVSFKIDPIESELGASEKGKLTQDGNKVIFEKGNRKYQLYELSESEDLPEGGFEYQIDLLEKPDSNIIELNIELKDLECYYQAELHPDHPTYDKRTWNEERQAWDYNNFRPENIVGSYACYHSYKRDHIIGQTNYMSGKAFHIYRVKATDKNGNWVWCDLNLDERSGIITETISWDFLNNATYPISIK